MPSNSRCVVPEDLTNNRRVRRAFTATQLDDIERRVNELDNRLTAGTQSRSTNNRFKQQARTSFKTRLKSAMRLVSKTFLKPEDKSGFQHWIAKNFAVWKQWGQLGSEATKPGMVRQYLKRAERLFTNDLPDTLGRLAIEEKMRTNQLRMQQLKKQRGISDKDFAELQTQAVELSYARWAKQYYDVGPAGFSFIQGRFNSFLNKMDELGLSKAEQEEILELGRQTADGYHQALEIAQRFGINVSQLENMEFFPRQLSEDVKRRFAWERNKDGGSITSEGEKTGAFVLSDGSTLDLGEAFMKSRNTHNYVIEDEIVLDAFLRKEGFFERTDIGNNIQSVNDLLDPANGPVLNEAIFNHLTDAQLGTLVDSGIVSKIPMTSLEFRDWLTKKFPLPSENLNTLMQTDWQRAFRGYRDQLKRTSGKSGMIWTMIANGIGLDGTEAPWGVTRAQKQADEAKPVDQQQFKGWKKLFPDRPNDGDSVLPEELMQQFVRGNVDQAGDVPQVYMHPNASDLFLSMLDFSEDPGKLGALGRVVQETFESFKRMAITTPSFIATQVVAPVMQIWAAGGNFLKYPEDMSKTLKAAWKVQVQNKTFDQALQETLDDTRRVFRGINGEKVTEKTLYKQGRRLGFLNDYVPGIGAEAGQSNKHFAFSPANLEGNARMMQANWKQLGALKGTAANAGDIANLGKRTLLDPLSAVAMLLTNEFENAGRFSTLKTLTFDEANGTGFNDKLRSTAQFATTQQNLKFDTLEGAVEHGQNYFFMFDDQGKLDQAMRDFVVPFWSYVSRNPPAQIRAAIRNPAKYSNVLRLYAATNGRERVEDKIGTAAENFLPDWVEDQRPIYWTMNADETDDPGKRNLAFYLPTRPIDPVGDAFELIGNTGDRILKSVGVLDSEGEDDASIAKSREEVEWLNTKTNKFIGTLLENTYGPYRGFAGAVMKQRIGQDWERLNSDPSKRKPTTFLGMKINPRVRYLLEETLPLVQRINDANPMGIFGKRGGFVISDEGDDIEMQEAEKSIFGQPRSDFDKNAYYDQVASKMALRGARTFFGVDFIDPMFNTAKTISDVRKNVRDLGDQIAFQREAISTTQDAERRKELQTEMEAMLQTRAEMQITLRRLEKWARENNVRPMEAYRLMRKNNIKPPELNETQKQRIRRNVVKEAFESEVPKEEAVK